MSIGLLLLDDHVAVRAGYRRLLESDARFHVTGEAGSADDAYAMLQALERENRMPQVAIVDLPVIEVASLVHRGGMENIGETYEALVRWIEDSGHRVTGYSRELYLEWDDDDASKCVTELQMPIAR